MKRWMVLVLTVLLVSAPLGICYAQSIYWDPSEPRDDTITDKDLTVKIHDADKAPATLGQLDVYDVPTLDFGEEEEADVPPAAVRATVPRSDTETPAYRETAPRRTRPAQGRTTTTPAKTETKAKPAVKPESERKPEAPAPTVSAEQETDKPETKKVPWGKVESQPPTTEPKKQLQWGKDK